MNPSKIFVVLATLGRTGAAELAISLYLFRFAYLLHSRSLVVMAIFILWAGLSNLWGFLIRRRPPHDTE